MRFEFQPVQRDAEVVAEDEQVFLMKQQSILNKQPAPAGVRTLNRIFVKYHSINVFCIIKVILRSIANILSNPIHKACFVIIFVIEIIFSTLLHLIHN